MHRNRRIRSVSAAVLLLLGFGIVRIPIESRLTAELQSHHFHGGDVRLDLKEDLGQGMFAAVLGGFRSLVASILHLQAYTAWENVEWGRIDGLYGLITRLQPRMASYWDAAHWQTAYNAASYYQFHDTASPSLREQLFQTYVEKGLRYLEDGIRNNPDDFHLTAQMAELYRRRIGDPCLAAEYFRRTADNPQAPMYYRRFEAYSLAQCPGREREALALLRELHAESPRHHKRSLFAWLDRLQVMLDVPAEDRIPMPDEFREAEAGDAASEGQDSP